MTSLTNKWVIYDGNCGLCMKSKQLLTGLGVLQEDKCLNFHKLDERLLNKIDQEHFSYEMALVDENSNQTLYGLEGILAIFSGRIPVLNKVRKGTILYMILDFFYHAISYNRYFLFPKKRVFVCDCEPPFRSKFYWRWIGLGILVSLVISFVLGIVAAPIFNKLPMRSGLEMLAIVGVGWLLQIGIAGLFMARQQFLDYTRHLALIAVIGVLVLLPSLFSSLFLAPNILEVLLGLNVLLSSALMLRAHFKRVRFMGLSQAWTVSWLLSLQFTAFYLALQFQMIVL